MARISRRRTPAGDDPEFTPDGAIRLDELLAEFRRLLESQAIQQARRRGAKGVDNTDVESAYRQLLKPRDRPLVVDVFAEVGLFAAGGLIGYAATLLTSDPPQNGPGVVMLVAGLFLGSLCAVLKHVRF